MEQERILAALREALAIGVAPYQPGPNMNPLSGEVQNYANFFVKCDPSIIDDLATKLRMEPMLALFDNGVILTGRQEGHRVSMRALAEWLLAQALKHSPETSVDDLVRFVRSGKTRAMDIYVLCGVIVVKPIQITNTVSLIPFDHVPPSYPKDLILGVSPRLNMSPSHFPARAIPTAALVRDYEVEPGMVADFPESQVSDHTEYQEIEDIVDSLTVAGPSAPVIISEWTQEHPSVPLAGTSSGSSYFRPEILPSHPRARAMGIIVESDIQSILSSYKRLSPQLKQALRVPIQRLNLSLRRAQPVDKAIELGIAFESLLVSDRDRDAQISFLLRLRGSLFLGGSGEERRTTYRMLRELYNLRSQAVHSGSLPSSVKIEGQEMNIGDMLWEGAKLCSRVICKLIFRGSVPNWDDLVLGVTPDKEFKD